MYRRNSSPKYNLIDILLDGKENKSNKGVPDLTRKLLLSIVVRLCSVFFTKSFFVPDEYWQSTEVAHWKAFGYGYLTWEWREQIRTYFYPFLFEIYFHILRIFYLDMGFLIVNGPHVIQSLMTAFADVSVYNLSMKMSNCKSTADFVYILNLTSWFIFYTGSRTLSNTAEMCFNVYGLSMFTLHSKSSTSFFTALIWGGIACIVRPTSAIIWAPLVLKHLFKNSFVANLISLLNISVILMSVMLLVDLYFYEDFVFAHFNFLKFNIFQNIGSFYGTHPWHWYFSVGLVMLLGTTIVFVIVGLLLCRQRYLIFEVMMYILIHSAIPHKEQRFLLPILPILFCYAGEGLRYVQRKVSAKLFMLLFYSNIFCNVMLALYFCLVHQRGTIDAMNFLRNEVRDEDSVLFLMPCHSTPYYSYLHTNASLRFLTCQPPGLNLDMSDEGAVFFYDPLVWLRSEDSLPNYVVVFNSVDEVVPDFLEESGYRMIRRFFHSFIREEQTGTHVYVYRKFDPL